MGYRHRPLSQRLGISFQEASYWKVDMAQAECFMFFIAGLRQVFGDGNILYIEGTELDMELEAFYKANAAPEPAHVQRLLRRSTAFHVLLNKESHKKLANFATCKTYPEICDALLVYHAGKILMDGSRIGDRVALFSGEIPEAKIKKFTASRALGAVYEWIEETN
jgi:hypothetical protein